MNNYGLLDSNKKERFLVPAIYIILALAIFSDILRIPDTKITFFRLSLPFALFIALVYKKYAKIVMGMAATLFLLSSIQYCIFYKIQKPELSFSISNAVKSIFLYFIMIIIFGIMLILRDREGERFEERFLNFIVTIGFVLIFIAILDILDRHFFDSGFFGGLKVDNENNYACFFSALFPFFLAEYQKKRKLRDIAGIILILITVVANDSKAALFGIVVSAIVFLCISMGNENRKKFFIYRYGLAIIAIIGIVSIIITNPSIHGYYLQDVIYQPIRRIIQNDPYPDYSSSISFRTNTTNYCLREMAKGGFVGFGPGTTGIMLKHQFPELKFLWDSARNSETISLHNPWLEILLDFGIVAIIAFFMALKYAFTRYFNRIKLSSLEKIRVAYILSFPIWVISASGIYTQYYLITIMIFLLIADDERVLE